MFIEKKRKEIKHPAGFTLIEIAIVILIIGVMTIPLVQLYSTYIQQKKIALTKTNLDQSVSEIARYSSYMGSYPAPASLTASPDDAGYGNSITAAEINALSPGLCTLDGGVCMVSGQRDTDADADSVADPVLIGAVPIKTIRGTVVSEITNAANLDGWNNKLTYAVTSNLTDPTKYENDRGVIGAVDEHYRKTAGINDDAHYVVISHGRNGIGAYTNEGGQTANCGSIVFDVGTGTWITTSVENHNCNSDGLFMQALQRYDGGSGLHYDDRVAFSKAQDLTLWEYTVPDRMTIYNKNAGNIGIKTGITAPTERLHIVGTLRAQSIPSTGANADIGVRAKQICQSDGSGCFDISAITGATGVQCPAGQVLRRISNIQLSPAAFAAANCATPTFPNLNAANCSGGWVHGIKTNGDVICYP